MIGATAIKTLIAISVAAAGLGFGIFASRGSESASQSDSAPQEQRALPVDVTVMAPRRIRVWTELSARLQAVDAVELRPQVSGAITEVRFTDGERVKKGEILFVIDPRRYRAAVAEATAALAAARDRLAHASKDLARARALVKTSAISRRVLDDRANAQSVSKSEVDAAKARLARARLDLDHAYVKAPISGRVSRAEITVGNLVQSGPGAPVLTSIVSDTEIYADFDLDEQTYLKFVSDGAKGVEAERRIPVRLSVGGEGGITVDGHIYSFDNRIAPSTGTIRGRALFANPSAVLLPGMFAQVKLGSPLQRRALLLAESVILTDQDRKYVYVINDDGRASYRQVTIAAAVGGRRIVTRGLSPGDRVITSNLMLMRPDVPVAAKDDTRSSAVNGITATGAKAR